MILATQRPAEMLFWVAMAAVAYIYLGYPLIISALARWFPKAVKKAPGKHTVSILISAYKEGPKLAGKIQNCLALDGADQILEILIGSDGGADDVSKALAGLSDPRIKLFPFEHRRGKPSVLNDLMQHARGDIMVMMDVRQKIDKRAMSALLANFADDAVGVVSGELVFLQSMDDTSGIVGIGAYWRYEKWIRKAEAAYHSVPGATGALYAIRRSLVRPLPTDLVLDDVVLPMVAVVQGKRCVFEPDAIAYDIPSTDVKKESFRKRRTIAGCIQLLVHKPGWCLPWQNPIAVQYASHKILRVFSPWFLLIALGASLALWPMEFYRYMVGVQVVAYGFGGVALMMEGRKTRLPLAGIAGMFLALQGIIMLAWWDYLTGRTTAAWDNEGKRSGGTRD